MSQDLANTLINIKLFDELFSTVWICGIDVAAEQNCIHKYQD